MTDTRPVEMRETHSAIVLLLGDRAYKIKKPVDLGFLDFREESTRERMCRRELELNRRLAPDVYLDVITIAGSDGHSYEHGVLMRRMPDELRLSRLLERGVAVDGHLDALARLMANFHATALRGPQISAEGMAGGLRRRWSDNLRESEQYRGTLLVDPLHPRISELALDYVDGRVALLAERAEAGLVVDGHADLLAEDVYCLPDYPRVLDCIEFDDRLRWVDVLDDVAFLAMDLEHLGHRQLGEFFLHRYAEYSGVPDIPSLRHHYLAYRAYVRAKVLCIQAVQGREAAAAEADRFARLALRHLEAGEVRLILVGGAPGTGKTTLARGLSTALGATHVGTDTVRAPRPDRYSDTAKAETYRELLQRAGYALERGRTVVADATWGDPAMRELAAKTAAATHSRLIAVECSAPVEVAAARAQRRLDGDERDESEAGGEIARTLAARRAPWPEAIAIDTASTPDRALRQAVDAISGTKVLAG